MPGLRKLMVFSQAESVACGGAAGNLFYHRRALLSRPTVARYPTRAGTYGQTFMQIPKCDGGSVPRRRGGSRLTKEVPGFIVRQTEYGKG